VTCPTSCRRLGLRKQPPLNCQCLRWRVSLLFVQGSCSCGGVTSRAQRALAACARDTPWSATPHLETKTRKPPGCRAFALSRGDPGRPRVLATRVQTPSTESGACLRGNGRSRLNVPPPFELGDGLRRSRWPWTKRPCAQTNLRRSADPSGCGGRQSPGRQELPAEHRQTPSRDSDRGGTIAALHQQARGLVRKSTGQRSPHDQAEACLPPPRGGGVPRACKRRGQFSGPRWDD